MTNFEYVIKNMKDTDLASYMSQFFDKLPVMGILAEAENTYWYQSKIENNRTVSVSMQVWLSKQYNPNEWKEAQENFQKALDKLAQI